MKRGQGLLLLSVLSISLISSINAQAQSSVPDIAERALRSIVKIHKGDSIGTGSIISSNGCIVTATHVLASEKVNGLSLELADGEIVTEDSIRIITFDTKNDISYLKVNLDRVLPAIEIVDSGQVRVGERVITIGYPNPIVMGHDTPTVDNGIIQSIHKDPIELKYFPSKTIIIEDAIRVNGTIRPGSSGGPVLDESGKLISIISIVPRDATVSNTAYTSPINRAPKPNECVEVNQGLNYIIVIPIILGLVILSTWGSLQIYRTRRKRHLLVSLSRARLFSALNEEDLENLYSKCNLKVFQKDQKLIRQGDLDQPELFYILEGQVVVQQDGKEIARRGTGRILGETAILGYEPRSADVIATEKTTCLVLEREKLVELIQNEPDIGLKMLEDLARRLKEANAKG